MSVPKTYRKFTREYKQNAVRLTLEANKTVRQVAAELGIAEKMLYRWRSQQLHEGADAFWDHGRRTAEEDELVRLRENKGKIRCQVELSTI